MRASGCAAQVEPRDGLDRVGVEHRLRRPGPHDLGDLGERLDDAGLVVHEHHRDDRGAVVEGAGERVEVDRASAVRGDPRDAESLALEAVARAEHRLVLDGGGDDAVGAAPLPGGPRRALDREIVGLAPAAGEHDLAGLAAADLGHVLPGGLERRLRRPRGRVHPRRVREVPARNGSIAANASGRNGVEAA